MKKSMVRKGIVFGIIVLFVGTSVTTDKDGINSKILVLKDRIDVEE